MCIAMKTWTHRFKLALLKEELETLNELLDSVDYKEVDLNEAKSLIEEAIKLVKQKKHAQAAEIQKFQKAIKYIKA